MHRFRTWSWQAHRSIGVHCWSGWACRSAAGRRCVTSRDLKAWGMNHELLAEGWPIQRQPAWFDRSLGRRSSAATSWFRLQGQVLGKPVRPLGRSSNSPLAGHAHELITAMAVIKAERRSSPHGRVGLAMRPLTRAAIERYVRPTGRSTVPAATRSKRGESPCSIKSSRDDHTAITGLPLIALVSILREHGL